MTFSEVYNDVSYNSKAYDAANGIKALLVQIRILNPFVIIVLLMHRYVTFTFWTGMAVFMEE